MKPFYSYHLLSFGKLFVQCVVVLFRHLGVYLVVQIIGNADNIGT